MKKLILTTALAAMMAISTMALSAIGSIAAPKRLCWRRAERIDTGLRRTPLRLRTSNQLHPSHPRRKAGPTWRIE